MSRFHSALKRRFPRITRGLADRWRWHLRPRHEIGTELRYRRILPLADLRPDDRVLEVGKCTYRTLALAQRVRQVTVCDLDGIGRSVATHGPRNLTQLQGDICTADLAPESFDIAFAIAVFEHIPDDRAAVRNLFRVLATAGRLLVYVPDTEEHLAAWQRGEYPDHVRPGYSPAELRELLEGAGFQVIHCALGNGAYSAVAGDLYHAVARRLPGFARWPRFVARPFTALAAVDDRRPPGSLRWGVYAKAIKPRLGAPQRLPPPQHGAAAGGTA